MDMQTVLLRVGASLLLGAIVGWERERWDKPAGFRTLTMVCVGSTLFIVVSLELIHDLASESWDPLRIVAAIIQGIGFLGASTVLQKGKTIRGLTTAAALWTVTAVGVAAGFGMYRTAVLGTVSVLVILRGLGYVERYWLASSDKPDKQDLEKQAN